ncbi:unnamed protein product [Protopolystoma xenopodis]|uniref:Uncharacterized protein n=1 Tax=Protopolystoma xenopodis TaxID=117903 RepID=A0A3S5BC47_9PLAT|nr:unnamed protein product [Protopolystoma xenopodis]
MRRTAQNKHVTKPDTLVSTDLSMSASSMDKSFLVHNANCSVFLRPSLPPPLSSPSMVGKRTLRSAYQASLPNIPEPKPSDEAHRFVPRCQSKRRLAIRTSVTNISQSDAQSIPDKLAPNYCRRSARNCRSASITPNDRHMLSRRATVSRCHAVLKDENEKVDVRTTAFSLPLSRISPESQRKPEQKLRSVTNRLLRSSLSSSNLENLNYDSSSPNLKTIRRKSVHFLKEEVVQSQSEATLFNNSGDHTKPVSIYR